MSDSRIKMRALRHVRLKYMHIPTYIHTYMSLCNYQNNIVIVVFAEKQTAKRISEFIAYSIKFQSKVFLFCGDFPFQILQMVEKLVLANVYFSLFSRTTF